MIGVSCDHNFMFFTFSQIINWLLHYKYFVLFPVTIIEGPIVTVIAGFLSSLGYLNVVIVYLLAVIGDLVGDSIYYSIGKWGKRGFIKRWGKYIGLNEDRIGHLEGHFQKHSGKTLIIGKWSHAVGAVVLIAAGVAEMSFWRFVWFNFIASIPKSLIFIFIGFYFGQAYSRIAQYLDYVAIIMIALTIALIAIYFIAKKISSKYEERGMDDDGDMD